MRSSTFVLATCLIASTALASGPSSPEPAPKTLPPTGPLATETLRQAIGPVTQIRIGASFERQTDPDMPVTDPAEVRAMLAAIGLEQRPTAVAAADCPDSVLLHFLNARLASVRVCIDRPLGPRTKLGAARVEIAIASPGVVQLHRGAVAIENPALLRRLLLARQRAFDRTVYGVKTAACPLGTEFPAPPRLYRQCTRDADCVAVNDGCCGCSGTMYFVLSKKYASCAAQTGRSCDMKETMCPPEPRACPGPPTCERGLCTVGPVQSPAWMEPQ